MYQNTHFRHHGNVSNTTVLPLVAEIARSLADEGAFVMHVETGEFGTAHLQAVVDVGWAARQAGQLLEKPVRVSTRLAADGRGLVVTAELGDGEG
jgi:hypothetical protein